jgi:tetratricopeptide (TPR) repeat protein
MLLTVALLLVAACGSVSTSGDEDRNRLATYLENAANYYDQAHYARAYQQWQQALDVEPDNVKGRLGQAMALYQLGRAPTREGLVALTRAEAALTDLLDDDLDGQEWKAELGYALVQDQWVQLYDRKIRLSERDIADEKVVDRERLAADRKELLRRIALGERTFRDILAGEEQEKRDRLTCIMSIARLTFLRGDLEESLVWCGAYESEVDKSKAFWRDAAARYPKERPIYESKVAGAERQEAELRDLMGSVLYKLRRFEAAEAELDKVLVLDPKRATAYLSRGIVRQERGDWDRARADYVEFLERARGDDDDPAIREAGARLFEVEALVKAEDDLRRETDRPTR